jgi:hypothetical protein
MTRKTPRTSRRELFRAAGRGLAAGTLAAGALVLGIRNRQHRALNPEDHKCVNQGICKGCRRFSGCTLPAAASAKRAGAGNK